MAELYGETRHGTGAEGIDPDSVLACLLVLDGDEPVGTVSLRRLRDLVEIKRMYLLPSTRGTGIAARLLAAIEARAAEITDRVVLHTGERQRAAIALYARSGYEPIEVYPPYDQVPESVCFAKRLGGTGVV
nr:GNAT family N-acetyltransferase [Aeromicrobium phoceense]